MVTQTFCPNCGASHAPTPIPEAVLAELDDGKEVSIRLICTGDIHTM